MQTRVHRLRQCRDLRGGSFALEVDGPQGERFRDWPYSKTCMEGPVYEACELVE